MHAGILDRYPTPSESYEFDRVCRATRQGFVKNEFMAGTSRRNAFERAVVECEGVTAPLLGYAIAAANRAQVDQ